MAKHLYIILLGDSSTQNQGCQKRSVSSFDTMSLFHFERQQACRFQLYAADHSSLSLSGFLLSAVTRRSSGIYSQYTIEQCTEITNLLNGLLELHMQWSIWSFVPEATERRTFTSPSTSFLETVQQLTTTCIPANKLEEHAA
jgi:hypothetical protein